MCLFIGTRVNATNDININDDFEDDSFLVLIKHDNSIINDKYEIAEFGHDNIKEITDLTEITGDVNDKTLLNREEFRQILKLELKVPGKDKVIEAIEAIEKLDFVECATPNYIMTVNSSDNNIEVQSNDSYVSNQYALNKMMVPNAWNFNTGSSNVIVGVLDTGIDSTHQDLANNVNVSKGANFTGDSYGLTDPHGHGTHVAGIIGAVGNNNIGVTGVAWNVTMVPLRIFNSAGSGSLQMLLNRFGVHSPTLAS